MAENNKHRKTSPAEITAFKCRVILNTNFTDIEPVAFAQAWLNHEKLLYDLTPGGSEFAGNPEQCAKWIETHISNLTRMLGDAKAENAKLRAEAVAKFEEAERLTESYIRRLHEAERSISQLQAERQGQMTAQKGQMPTEYADIIADSDLTPGEVAMERAYQEARRQRK